MRHNLTILICTHNRAELLGRVFDSLNQAAHPNGWQVQILVAANNCSDDTVASLIQYQAEATRRGWLSLQWFEEPMPGKPYALNHAIKLLTGDAVAFVDDDHRVDHDYLTHICRSLEEYPEATMFCGRILPDWDGSEPAWAHDTGPYRIYPLPVPRYDQGMEPRLVTLEHGPLPGGGNLFLRTGVFGRVGNFSTELGPHGHDLGGGEDSDFVLTALQKGERLQYVPEVLQHHYVDTERLKFGYLLRKSYQRSRSVLRVHHKVESFRLTKRYFRRWRFQTSRNIAQSKDMTGERRLFNIPLYVFPQFLRAVARMLWGHISQPKDEAFNRELVVCHFLGTLQGLWMDRKR